MATKIQYEEKHSDAFVPYVTMIKHIKTISEAAHSRKLIMKMVFLLSTELTFGLKFKTSIQEIPFYYKSSQHFWHTKTVRPLCI